MKRLRSKLTYANVVSTLCLSLLVGGGTAFAATQMLPKNSVGSQQLKTGAVTPSKLDSATKAALRGATGASGEAGPQGAPGVQGAKGEPGDKGEQGERGPSNALAKAGTVSAAWSMEYEPLFSMSIPAGSWIVTATAVAVNEDETFQEADCRLVVGGQVLQTEEALTLGGKGDPGERVPLTLTGGVELPGASAANLQCRGSRAGKVVKPNITAVQVGAVTLE